MNRFATFLLLFITCVVLSAKSPQSVITFENTDPLFVVDLSNPSEPKLLGNVEITGFSSQLVPVDENTILGIGEESITDKNGDFVSGTKRLPTDLSAVGTLSLHFVRSGT